MLLVFNVLFLHHQQELEKTCFKQVSQTLPSSAIGHPNR